MEDGVQLVIAPTNDAEGNPFIIIGFHSKYFSQAVNLPYKSQTDIILLSQELTKGLMEAATQINMNLGDKHAVRNQEKREEVSDN